MYFGVCTIISFKCRNLKQGVIYFIKQACGNEIMPSVYFMEGPPKLHIEMDSCRSQQCVGSSRSVQRQQCFKAVIVVGSDNRIKISFSGVEPFSDLALLCLLRFFARKNVVKMLRRCQPHFSCYNNIIFICVIFISSSVHSGRF